MTRPVESELTISCLQCDWSVETVNTPAQVSRAFLEAAHSHANEHEQHALEVVQRLVNDSYSGRFAPVTLAALGPV